MLLAMTDLPWLLLLANTISAAFVLLLEFSRRGGYVTLPFLTALIFLIWYLPQAWTIMNQSAAAPQSLIRLYLMSLLCFWAMIYGWHRGLGRKWRPPHRLDIPVKRLLGPVFAITLFALSMHALINIQPAEVRAMGRWTGPITIIYFFSTVSVVSMALSTAMVMKRVQASTVILFALNLSIYLPRIFLYFRRGEMFEFALVILLSLLFVRRYVMPRTIILAGAIVGLFVVNGIGHLRSLSGGYQISSSGTIETRIPTFAEISEIDWFAAVEQTESIHRSETMNAVIGMEAIALYGDFTLGAQFWNLLVDAYVPGQIVGHDLKRDLKIGVNATTLAFFALDFEKHPGTSSTGFVQPYHDFWFFGCFVWWLTGYVMARFMRNALGGSVVGFALYATTITNAILVTTHFGYYLFSQSLLILITILLLRYWLSKAPRKHKAVSSDGVVI